jgi:hypothetical protein
VYEKQVVENSWDPRKRTELEAGKIFIIRILIFLLFTFCCFDGVRVERNGRDM